MAVTKVGLAEVGLEVGLRVTEARLAEVGLRVAEVGLRVAEVGLRVIARTNDSVSLCLSSFSQYVYLSILLPPKCACVHTTFATLSVSMSLSLSLCLSFQEA